MAALNDRFRGAVSTVKTKLRKRSTSDFFRHTTARDSEGALYRRSIVPSKLAHDLGDSVISTAFSDDDLLYAAGCTNKVAKVWERASGKEIARFQAAAAITAVVFISHGGRTKLVVGTFAGQLHFFDVATQKAEQTHKFGRGDAVHCMAATSSFRNGGGVAGGRAVPATPGDGLSERPSTGSSLMPSSASVAPLPPASLPPIGVAPASPPNRRYSCSPLKSRKRIRAPTGLGSGSNSDEILLVVGGKFSHVVMYLVQYSREEHAHNMAQMGSLNGEAPMATETEVGLVEIGRVQPFGTVNSLAIDRSASLLVTGGEAKVVELWSVPRAAARLGGGSWPETRFTCKSAVWSVALTPTGDTLAVGTSTHTEVYVLQRLTPSQDAASEPEPPTGSPSSPGSPGREHGHGPRTDALVSYEPLLFLECPAHQGGVAFAVSRHAEKIVPRSREDAQPGRRLSGWRPSIAGSGAGMSLAAAAMAAAAAAAAVGAGKPEEETKKHMLVVGGNQLVSVFDIYTSATLLKLQRDGRVRCVALSNDGSALVVGGFDRKVVLHPNPNPDPDPNPKHNPTPTPTPTPTPSPSPTPTPTKQGGAARRG